VAYQEKHDLAQHGFFIFIYSFCNIGWVSRFYRVLYAEFWNHGRGDSFYNMALFWHCKEIPITKRDFQQLATRIYWQNIL
jgi:hypothetical protein